MDRDFAWPVINYEATMLTQVAALKSRDRAEQTFEMHVENALTESLGLHCKLLADLLLSRGTELHDINLDKLTPIVPKSLDALAQYYGLRETPSTPAWRLHQLIFTANGARCDRHSYTDIFDHLIPLIARSLREAYVALGYETDVADALCSLCGV